MVILFIGRCYGDTIINVLKTKLFVIVRRPEMILFLRNGLEYRNCEKTTCQVVRQFSKMNKIIKSKKPIDRNVETIYNISVK